jgi:hypothetical protein
MHEPDVFSSSCDLRVWSTLLFSHGRQLDLFVLEVPEHLGPKTANSTEHELSEKGEPDGRCAGNEIWSLPYDICNSNDVFRRSFYLLGEQVDVKLEFSSALFKNPLSAVRW